MMDSEEAVFDTVDVDHDIQPSMNHVVLILAPAGENLDLQIQEVKDTFNDMEVSIVILQHQDDNDHFSLGSEDTCKYWFDQISKGRVIMVYTFSSRDKASYFISNEAEASKQSSRTPTACWGNCLTSNAGWNATVKTNLLVRSQLIFTYAACKFKIPTVWRFPRGAFFTTTREWRWLCSRVTYTDEFRDGVHSAVFGERTIHEAVSLGRAWARPRADAS